MTPSCHRNLNGSIYHAEMAMRATMARYKHIDTSPRFLLNRDWAHFYAEMW